MPSTKKLAKHSARPLAQGRTRRPTAAIKGTGKIVNAWTSLDNLRENDTLKRGQKLAATKRLEPEADARESPRPDKEWNTVPSDYDGPTVSWPITPNAVLKIIEKFKTGKLMHPKYILEIAERATSVLAAEPNINKLVIPKGVKMTVVGDIHGQLSDLLSIFMMNGMPAPEVPYLFNGDFVDRGDMSVECLMVLCCFKLLYPGSFWMNRGNHECRAQNKIFGFEEEVLKKYRGPNGRKVLHDCQTLFDALPLAALLQERIFVVHGGLWPYAWVTLDHVLAIDRKKEPVINNTDSFEDIVMESMLWSDPRPDLVDELYIPNMRGAGIEFSDKLNANFLKLNQLSMLIRSHEMIDEGFEIIYSGRLMTVFSASRYCNKCTNKGAFLQISSDSAINVHQYYAHSMSEIMLQNKASADEKHKQLIDDVISMFAEQLMAYRVPLYEHFCGCERTNKKARLESLSAGERKSLYSKDGQYRRGQISIDQWADGLKSVMPKELNLDYAALRDYLVPFAKDGYVSYIEFLEHFRVESEAVNSDEWQDQIVDSICQQLFEKMGAGNAEKAFKEFDKNGDGLIDYDEFKIVLKGLDVDLSEEQIFELMRAFDKDGDATINPVEFSGRLEVVFSKLFAGGAGGGDDASGEYSADDKEMLQKLGQHFCAQKLGARGAFLRADAAGSGSIDLAQMQELVAGVDGIKCSKAFVAKLFSALDSRGDGKVTEADFTNSFKVVDRRGSSRHFTSIASATIAQKAARSIGRNASILMTAARRLSRKQPTSPGGDGGDGDADNDDDGSDDDDEKGPGWQDMVLQQIKRWVLLHRNELRAVFREYDVDNEGDLSMDQFEQALKTTSQAFDNSLTNSQITHISAAVDTNADGRVVYEEFLDGFTVKAGQQPAAAAAKAAPKKVTTLGGLDEGSDDGGDED